MTADQMIAIFVQYGGADWAYKAWLGAIAALTFLAAFCLPLAIAGLRR